MEYKKCVEQLRNCLKTESTHNEIAEELSQLIENKIHAIESKKVVEFDDKDTFLQESSLIKVIYAETADGLKKFSFFYWNFPYLRIALKTVTHDNEHPEKELETPMLGIYVQHSSLTDIKTHHPEIQTMKLLFVYICLQFIRPKYSEGIKVVLMPPEMSIDGLEHDPSNIIYIYDKTEGEGPLARSIRHRTDSARLLRDVLKKATISANYSFIALNALYPGHATSTLFETNADCPSLKQINKEKTEFLKTEQLQYLYLRLNSIGVLDNDIEYWQKKYS